MTAKMLMQATGFELTVIQAVGVIGFVVVMVVLILWITARQAIRERQLNAESILASRKEAKLVEDAKEAVIRETQEKLEALYKEMLADERKDKERLEKRVNAFETEIETIRTQNRERENQHAEAIAAMQRYQRQKDKQHSDVVKGKDKEIEQLAETKTTLQKRVDTLEEQMRTATDNQSLMQQEISEKIGFETELTKELERRLRERGADTSELRTIRETVTDRIKKKKENPDGTTDHPPGGGQ